MYQPTTDRNVNPKGFFQWGVRYWNCAISSHYAKSRTAVLVITKIGMIKFWHVAVAILSSYKYVCQIILLTDMHIIECVFEI